MDRKIFEIYTSCDEQKQREFSEQKQFRIGDYAWPILYTRIITRTYGMIKVGWGIMRKQDTMRNLQNLH